MKQIKIGVIIKTHGLKGEVKIKSLTDFPNIRFKKGNCIQMQGDGEPQTLKVESFRIAKEILMLKFEGYDNINEVEGWRGNVLSIDESALHMLEEDEAYFFELQDSDVYDLQDQYIGKVIEVIETGANAVLRVKMEEGEVLIPFVKACVKEFDKKEKKMKVEMMEGLL